MAELVQTVVLVQFHWARSNVCNSNSDQVIRIRVRVTVRIRIRVTVRVGPVRLH